MPMNNMELMEKEGKPSTVTSEKWSQTVRKEKWMLMYRDFDKISLVFGFFVRAQVITKDADTFSKAMTGIFEDLCLRKQFFLETGTLFAHPFTNDIENKLHGCLCDSIY